MYKFVASEAVVWVARNGKKVAFGGGKIKPRNYKFIQLSPTVQATFSNIKRSHGGREVKYLKYFKYLKY